MLEVRQREDRQNLGKNPLQSLAMKGDNIEYVDSGGKFHIVDEGALSTEQALMG